MPNSPGAVSPLDRSRASRLDTATAELASRLLTIFRPDLSEGAPMGQRLRAEQAQARLAFHRWVQSGNCSPYRGQPQRPPTVKSPRVPHERGTYRGRGGDPTVYRFINGGRIELARRADMCFRYGIDSGAMCDLVKGKARSAKGWRLVGAV